MMDRNWMRLPNRLCKEYIDGIKSFMDVAKKCVDKNNQVRCPCVKCMNVFFKPLDVVENHLYKPGMSVSYQRWVYHGEKHELGSTSSINHVPKEPQVLTGRSVDDRERHDPYASSSRERFKPQSSNQGDERISLVEGDNFNTIDGWTSPAAQNKYEALCTMQSNSEMSQAAFGKRSRYAVEFGVCVKPSHCEGEASHEAALRAKIKKQRTKVESQCIRMKSPQARREYLESIGALLQSNQTRIDSIGAQIEDLKGKMISMKSQLDSFVGRFMSQQQSRSSFQLPE